MEFIIGLAVGVVAGGAVVYVFHAKIKKKWEEVANKAKAEADELKAKVDELKNK